MIKLEKDNLPKLFKDGKNISGNRLFIDFYANWWGPCKIYEQVLNEVTPEYSDKINLYKVDISEHEELAVAFGARSIPHNIFISKNSDVTAQPGSLDKDTLKYYLEGLIQKN